MRFYKLYFFLTLFIFFTIPLSANVGDKKNILMLHSYHSGMTWVENINKAVNDILKPDKNNYVIYTEYMDTKRHNSPEYYESLKEIYTQKYKNIKFDLILASDNNAFNFLTKNRNSIFKDVPVSFCGVNGFEPKMIENHNNYTGVAEQFSIKETVDLIIKLHPNIKNIYIINDYLITGLAWKKDMKKALKEYQSKVKFIYSKNLTLEELKNKVNSLDKDTVVLLGVYFADKEKNYITYEKVGSYLLEGSSSAVYCLLNFNISNNVIGGKVIGGYSQGVAMSKTALRILNGESANTINVKYSDANKFVFNYNGLNKYKIDQSLLPENSILINKPFSLYEEYKFILFNLILIFVILLIVLIAAFIYLKLKNKNKINQNDYFIINMIRFAPVLLLPIVIAGIVWLFIYSTNKNYDELKELEKNNYIEQMKKESKREVDRFIQIAQLHYQSSYDQIEKSNSIKKHLLDIAQNIKYGKSGYLIVGDMDGYLLAHTTKSMIGVDFSNGVNPKAHKIINRLKEKAKNDTNGFISYIWMNPYSKVEERKITYVNYLPELNWYVASGVYLDELDQYLTSKIKKNEYFDTKNIHIIIIASILLFIIGFTISIMMSIMIKNAFKRYRENIIQEMKKSQRIEKSKKNFEELANTDYLTKVHSRRSIINRLNDELILIDDDKSLCLIMFDLDNFKSINDNYGHDVGDKVLIEITTLIKKSLRENDSIGRVGGEEFLIILPNTNLSIGKEIAERLRKEIEEFKFTSVKNLTASFGIVAAQNNEIDTEMLKRVDQLLYQSKQDGRNRVSF